MKGFRFRLDRILRLRRVELEARRGELEREQQALERERVEAERAADVAVAATVAFATRLVGGADASQIRAAWAGRSALLAASRREGARLDARRERVDARQRDVVDAWRGRRSLEVLRRRAVEAWRKEDDRREQASTDEVASRVKPR